MWKIIDVIRAIALIGGGTLAIDGWFPVHAHLHRRFLLVPASGQGPELGTKFELLEVAAALAAPGTRITVDSGAHMFSIMALWRAAAPHDVLKSNGLSTMGFALPAAIAAALVEPARPVIAFTGDGGLMMCLAELATAAQHGCRLTVVVLNDAALSLIDVKQRRQQRPPEGVR